MRPGIGRAVALSLADAGADVAVNYVSGEDQAESLAAEIRNKGVNAAAVRADVSDEAQVQAMFSAVIGDFGTLDILVNNAGLQQDAPLNEMTLAQWNRVIGVNLTGQFLCSREAVREFRRRGVRRQVSCSAGKIICISSVHEVIPWAGHVNYAASKGGVMLMMKSIAQEVAPYRIRVNSICPVQFAPRSTCRRGIRPRPTQSLMKLIPYKRIGEAQEIGHAAVWLCSDYADYVHGISLFVDGGMTLYPGFDTGG